jgi:hypothetical protein
MTPQMKFKKSLPRGNAIYNNPDRYAGHSPLNGGNSFCLFTLPSAEISQTDDWYFLCPDENQYIPTGWISSNSRSTFHNYQGSAYGLTVPNPGSRHPLGVHMSQSYNSTVDAQIQQQITAVNWAL